MSNLENYGSFTRVEMVVPSDKRDYMATVAQRLSKGDAWQVAMLAAISEAETLEVAVPFAGRDELSYSDLDDFTKHAISYLRQELLYQAASAGKSVVAYSEMHMSGGLARMQARVVPVGEVPWTWSR